MPIMRIGCISLIDKINKAYTVHVLYRPVSDVGGNLFDQTPVLVSLVSHLFSICNTGKKDIVPIFAAPSHPHKLFLTMNEVQKNALLKIETNKA